MIWIVLAVAALGLAAVLWTKNTRAEAQPASRNAKTQSPDAMLAANPRLAPFVRWQEQHALPAVALTPGGPAPEMPGGSRIGGPVWLPAGEGWPVGKDGKPLSFLAQIDFAALPPLEDYPRTGVLQFFIGRDDHYGADFEKPDRGNFKVIYRESVSGPGTLHRPKPQGDKNIDDYTPLYDKTVSEGAVLMGRVVAQRPSTSFWKYPIAFPHSTTSRAADEDLVWKYIEADVEANEDRYAYGHHVGGHIELTQSEFREPGRYDDYDRVLLQLWSDSENTLMWGDSGQGNFLIRRADLLKRDFSRVIYQWDCY